MPHSLPTELLPLVASFAPHSTLASLALASTSAYAVSTRFLYTSVAPTGVVRATKCLRTIASNTQLARLVRACAIKNLSEEHRGHEILPDLVARALGGMVNLTELSLQLGVSCSSTVFKRTTFKLHKLVCVIKSDPDYPVSRFLESQPAIESLYLVCEPEGLLSLSSTALLVLCDITAPISLLQHVLPSRLEHITRITSLGSISTEDEIWELVTIFRDAPTKPVCNASVELVLGLDLRPASSMDIGASLMVLGRRAPWVGSLRLEVHHGRVEQEIMESLLSVPFGFSALHTFVIVSQPQPQPPQRAYTQPKATPDALHDATALKAHLGILHILQPTLKRVVFPVGVYQYVKDVPREHQPKCTIADCPTLLEAVSMDEDGWILVPESTLLFQTLY